MIRPTIITGLVFAAVSFAGPVHADPCTAIPEHGPMPTSLLTGARFAGPVINVGDGDSLCVAVRPERSAWVEVRLVDYYAPELHEPGGAAAKSLLERVALGRYIRCRAQRRSYDRVIAQCWIANRALGEILLAAGGHQGGRGWGR